MHPSRPAIPPDPPSQAKVEAEPASFATKCEDSLTPFGTKGVDAQQRGDGVRPATSTSPSIPLPAEGGRQSGVHPAEGGRQSDVLRLADTGFDAPTALLARHGLELVRVGNGEAIPGCYWGEPEAGVIASRVYARADTPVHSLLHEACHLLVADPARRASIHTDASDSLEEEDATCYLQIVLADGIPGFGRARAFADMDAWGYSFRLGSSRAWFEQDADDARAFLEQRGLLPTRD